MQVRQKLQRITAMLIVITIVTAILVVPVLADTGMVFSVIPVLPENQANPGLGYFDLNVEAGASQTLELQVHNGSDEEITLEVGAANASTASGGFIDYTAVVPADETMAHQFADIVVPKEKLVKVPANKTASVLVDVKIPTEAFDGIILGGIRVTDITERLEREAQKAKGEDLGIKVFNEYEYVVGARFRENDKVVEPNFELINIEVGLSNYESAIFTSIRNPQPLIVKGAMYYGAIYPKGSNDEIFGIEGIKVGFAPNSVMKYEFVDKAGYGLDPGNYTFKGKIEFEGTTWDFEDDFTILKEEVDQINEQVINEQAQKNTSSVSALVIILVIIVLLILIVLVILLLKLNKMRK